jgi:NTP pyrophosphatase (non-canonical NTP hydrolase)
MTQAKLFDEDLTFQQYTAQADLTAIYPEIRALLDEGGRHVDISIIYPALKLAGEAGEVAEKVGKIIRDKSGMINAEDKRAIAKELGDVLWYLNALANEIGADLEAVARMNLTKLAERAERGTIGGSGDNR